MIPHLPFALRAVGFLAALFAAVVSTVAQTAGTGSVEGRVFNPATGEYLELARVSVDGTALETLNDAAGYYRRPLKFNILLTDK